MRSALPSDSRGAREPELPRFALPNEHEHGDAADDPLDVAKTAQRAPVTAAQARRVVRRAAPRAEIRADGTEEVAVEDILFEAYLDEPEPPRSRAPRTAPLPTPAASANIAAAIAAAVPPPHAENAHAAQSAAVDALLRASDPAFAYHAPVHRAPAFAPADDESPSVAPVELVAMAERARRPAVTVATAPRRRAGAWIAASGAALLAVGIAGGIGAVLALPPGTAARWASGAQQAAARAAGRGAEAKPDGNADAKAKAKAEADALAKAHAEAEAAKARAEVEAAKALARAKAEADARATTNANAATAAASPETPVVAVNALPKPAVAKTSTLVTFPRYAQGHRVFVDGAVISAGPTPTTLKCGRHTIKIGSAGKPRPVDLPCGAELVME